MDFFRPKAPQGQTFDATVSFRWGFLPHLFSGLGMERHGLTEHERSF